jgi:hypothetical protein
MSCGGLEKPAACGSHGNFDIVCPEIHVAQALMLAASTVRTGVSSNKRADLIGNRSNSVQD